MQILIDQDTLEIEDKWRREMNLVIFNLEGISQINVKNKQRWRITKFISNRIGIKDLKIETSYRLGKRQRDKTNVLLLILKEKKQRKMLLDNAKN